MASLCITSRKCEVLSLLHWLNFYHSGIKKEEIYSGALQYSIRWSKGGTSKELGAVITSPVASNSHQSLLGQPLSDLTSNHTNHYGIFPCKTFLHYWPSVQGILKLQRWPLGDAAGVISEHMCIKFMSTSCKITLVQRGCDGNSTFVHVMAWCGNYLRQCWCRSMLLYDITRPQWVALVNSLRPRDAYMRQ